MHDIEKLIRSENDVNKHSFVSALRTISFIYVLSMIGALATSLVAALLKLTDGRLIQAILLFIAVFAIAVSVILNLIFKMQFVRVLKYILENLAATLALTLMLVFGAPIILTAVNGLFVLVLWGVLIYGHFRIKSIWKEHKKQ